MNKQKYVYNNLLRRYYKYIRRRNNLILNNSNQRRQHILKKHIEHLYEQLFALKIGFQRGTIVAAIGIGAMAFQPQKANAQINYAPVQTNPFSLVNVGTYSSPTFVDLDNDGDMDLMVGEYLNNVKYFENTGTSSAPVYNAPQTNPFSLSAVDYFPTPDFADLDNDGDMDLIVGGNDGDFRYFENIGTASSPVFGLMQTNPFSLTNVGFLSNPTWVDLDNDGDFDLMTGSTYSNLKYFENTGTALSPAFGSMQTNPFSLAVVGSQQGTDFADLDNDGDLDLMSGNQVGGFLYFENIGSVSSPNFATYQLNPFNLTVNGNNSSTSFADLDNDGDLDLITGAVSGDLFYFEYVASPEILISGNSNEIIDGDTSPSVSDSTDFDFVCTSSSRSITYTIENSGIANLNITTPISITGANAADFTVTTQPSATIIPGGSTNFTIKFIPSTSSSEWASVEITNDDPDESLYDFMIQGYGLTSSSGSQTLTICNGTSVTVGTNSYNTTGIYTDVLTGSNGCDSTVTTDLTVDAAIDVTIDNTLAPTISSNQTGASYQWIDCNNSNSPIAGETNQNFTATVTGDYAVEVTVGLCSETSSCTNVVITSIEQFNAISLIEIYPNPNKGSFSIATNEKLISLVVYDALGKIVLDQNEINSNQINVKLSVNRGIYFVKIETSNSSAIKKLIIE